VASCLLGAGCKEVIVTLPVAALAYDALFLTGSWRESLRRRWGLYLGLALCCGLVACRFILRAHDASSSVGFGMRDVTPWQYALTQPGVILYYLRLSFWPWPLCLDYGWPLVRSVGDALPALLGIGVLLAVTLAGIVRGRRWGFLGLAFFCILAPTSSIVPIRDAACEHRMYLPLAAVMAGAVLAGFWCWNRAWPAASGRWSGCALAGAAILAVAGLGVLTVRRNAAYQDEVSFWEQTVRCAPRNARAYGNLGYALERREGWEDTPAAREEALRVLNQAIALKPDYAEAYYNRGKVYAAAQRYAEAMRDYEQAIALKPDCAEAYLSRGNIHAFAGRYAEAMRDYEQAIAFKPDYAEAWFNRGAACAGAGHPEAALRDLDRAIALQPDYAKAYVSRGNLHAAARRYADAIRDYDQAIALKPGYAAAWFNRGSAYANAGRPEEALRDLDQAIALKPDDAEARFNRGNLHAAAQRYAEAIRDYDRAIACDPNYADAWYNRGCAYLATDRPAEAVRDFTRVIELRPQGAAAYYNRAIARKRMKQDSEALADLRMVRKLGGTVPEELLRSLGPSAQPPR
jgi:tetratricopeptide (TPR) repeat protein